MKLIRRVFMALNIAAVLLFLGASMAGIVRPSSVVWCSMLSYLFVPLLILNVLFVLVWLCFARKEFLISAVAIALRMGLVPLFFQVGGNVHSDEEDAFTVMSYNVHHFHGREFVGDIKDLSVIDSNAREFLTIVDSLRPQLLCMEEYAPKAHKTDVAGALMARGYRHAACAIPGQVRVGVVLYSKYPIANVVYIDSSSKMAVDVVRGRDTMRVVCVHMGSYKLDEEDYAEFNSISRGDLCKDSIRSTYHKVKRAILTHEEEWDQMKSVLEDSPYPTLLAGDLNDTPASYLYQKIAGKDFADCYKEQGKGFCTTYHGKFPAFRIDYIFHSDEFECVSYRRWKSDVSDHYPICAQLLLLNER